MPARVICPSPIENQTLSAAPSSLAAGETLELRCCIGTICSEALPIKYLPEAGISGLIAGLLLLALLGRGRRGCRGLKLQT